MHNILSTLFLLLCGTTAHAQKADITDKHQHIDTCAHLEEIIVTGVTGNAKIRETPAPVSTIPHAALTTHQSTNIIDAISRQPGVNQITTGGSISKPVIRGLGYNRVLVMHNGVRQEGQQWGDEHGIEIDGNTVYSVELLKGPASLMYGSDAMAGVIIMHDAPFMQNNTMRAEFSTGYQTNNGLADYSLSTSGNRNGVLWAAQWSQKFAHDYKAPTDGYIPGTRFREHSLSGMLGLKRSWGHSLLRLSAFRLKPSMTEIEEEEEAEEHGHEGDSDYSITAPFQKINHLKLVSNTHVAIGEGWLKTIIGYQQNRRDEYETPDESSLSFKLHTLSYDVRYTPSTETRIKTNFGVNGMWQRSENLGTEYLIPAYRLFDFGAFATLSTSLRHDTHLSGGLRYDIRNLHSLQLTEDGEERFEEFRRTFNAFSGSIGVIHNIGSHIDVRANISHGFRAPNISELASNGIHEGTFRYERGDNSLDPEHSLQLDLGLDISIPQLSVSFALFANRIYNYIFLARTAETEDDMPVSQFTQGDARLLGGEMRIVWHPVSHLHFENSFSYIDARQLHAEEDSKYLPFIPAPRWISTLHYDIPTPHTVFRNMFAEVEADINFRQDHIMTANNTETPTPSYTLFALSFATDIMRHGNKPLCQLSLSVNNIFNCAYQSHLSRLKYAPTLPVTGREGYNNMGRNIAMRITFPLEINL